MSTQNIDTKFDAIMCEMRAAGLTAQAIAAVMEPSLLDDELYALATTERASRLRDDVTQLAYLEQTDERREPAKLAERLKRELTNGKRWKAIATYCTPDGMIGKVHWVDEIGELQFLFENSPDDGELIYCQLFSNKPVGPMAHWIRLNLGADLPGDLHA